VSCTPQTHDVILVSSVLPANAVADTVLPTMGIPGVSITEAGELVWADGKYVAGAPGVTGAVGVGDAVAVSHGSGEYHFTVSIPRD
jgi:hypothetical protein